MTDWNPRANEIFLSAVEIASPQQRDAFIDQACGGDVELRSAVEMLLRAGEQAARSRFLESRADLGPLPTGAPPAAESGSAEPIGTVIGNYQLVERIGEGGFGVVYLAEQLVPVRRRVALKVVKPGMDSAQVTARFEAERQALAMMDHPNIAKVLDADTTENGRPFFVMELVEGTPITQFCDAEQLALQQRLELFIPVCQAVQHAHQKGIIHRDLKPSNVLIARYDGRPVPKVIDFGVAKAVAQRLSERTVFTQVGGIIGTLEYMAPEQAELNNNDIDTRADIYSLGVILYELLAGSPPFTSDQLRGAAFEQMLKMIREVEPAKPSTRLSTAAELPSIAARRKLEPVRLRRQVRGELDWIVMKCLEKDRSRRYETVNGLVSDVNRYLADEPVRAGPPSRIYRARKFVRRHRATMATALLLFLLLSAGFTGTTIGLLEAREQRNAAQLQRADAERARDNVQAVNDFLTDEILGAADPRVARGREISVKEALDKASAKVGGKFSEQPLTEADVRNTLAITYHSLGRADLGLPHARVALDIRRKHLGNQHPDTLKSMNNLGVLLRTLGRVDETEVLWREALASGRRLFGPSDPKTLTWAFNLAHLVEGRGNVAEAELMYRDVLNRRRASIGEEDAETLAAQNRLGGLLIEQRRFDEAESLLVDALAKRRRALGSDHVDTLNSINDLGMLRENQKRFDECEALYREAQEGYRQVLGADHPFTLVSVNNTASLLMKRGRAAEAEPLLRETADRSRRTAGADHPRTVIFVANLATAIARQDRYAEAEGMLIDVINQFASVQGVPPSWRTRCIDELVSLYERWDKTEPGRGYHRQAVTWRRQLPPAPATATRPSG